ncbi:hypothetical protein IEQ34_015598 [Dendrobium chrysotoxum]|uniref:Pentatricopeptide repeat-containing protein n=1 Tax=Dendrobium chrysotoxum TaxID=161865 RepID=A0AAV7GGD0_DENCH|nr:hypothetical protein IEQ34_015598 [Dendrobium chrysotoxum]
MWSELYHMSARSGSGAEGSGRGHEAQAAGGCTGRESEPQGGSCEQTIEVLRLMEEEGIEPNLIMLNLLINAFGIAGRYKEAVAIFEQIKETGISPDVITYTTLMKAFIRARKYDQVPIIYKQMEFAGCTPDRKAREILQNALIALEQRRGRIVS